LRELALFAGAGGGILGTHLLGFRVVCAVEKDAFAREVLLRRQEDGILPCFPIWDDVRTFDCAPWRGRVDIVSAGFPCQPFSVAGRRRGEDDERNLWPATIEIIRGVQPEWCLLENVPGLISSGYFGRIIKDLAEAGYDAEWDCIAASETGAPHRRDRLWIVAHTQRTERGQEAEERDDADRQDAGRKEAPSRARERGDYVPHSESNGRQQGRAEPARQQGGPDSPVSGGEVPDAEVIAERPGLCENASPGERGGRSGNCNRPADVADADRRGCEVERGRGLLDRERQTFRHDADGCDGSADWWIPEPDVGRVADELAEKLDITGAD